MRHAVQKVFKGHFGLAVLMTVLWLMFMFCVFGCGVSKRTADIQQTHKKEKDSLSVKEATTSDRSIKADNIQLDGTDYFMSPDRKPIQKDETLDEYAADNSVRIRRYNYKRHDTAARERAAASLAIVQTKLVDSTGKKKITVSNKDTNIAANFKIKWWFWLILLIILGTLLYLRIRKAGLA